MPGQVYVYNENGVYITTLAAPDGATNDEFGRSVAIDGDLIYVGAPKDDNQRGIDAGAVYIFKHNGAAWQYLTKVIADDGVTGDGFGWAVAASSGRAFASAYFASTPGHTSNGVVYAFHQNSNSTALIFDAKLTASDAYNFAGYGDKIACAGYNLAVADRFADVSGVSNTGKIYCYNDSSGPWTEGDALTVTPLGRRTSLRTVDLDGWGEPRRRRDRRRRGLLRRYYSGNLTQTNVLVDPSPTPDDAFGTGVGISYGRMIVGDAENLTDTRQRPRLHPPGPRRRCLRCRPGPLRRLGLHRLHHRRHRQRRRPRVRPIHYVPRRLLHLHASVHRLVHHHHRRVRLRHRPLDPHRLPRQRRQRHCLQ